MEQHPPAPAVKPTALSLAALIGDIEGRRAEVKQQHETARMKCLVLEDDLKEAAAARDDAASRYNELTAQVAYLRSLAQPPAAQPPSA